MESILASTEDHLLSSLSFKIPPKSGASYVQSKTQATYFPQGGDVYNPAAGQRILRFALSSDGYMDMSSLVISMDLTNGPAAVATPLVSGAHALFSRVRLLVSGTEVDNIEYANVVSEMFHRLQPAEKRLNVELMGFAGNTVAAGATKSILYKPLVVALCNQPLW